MFSKAMNTTIVSRIITVLIAGTTIAIGLASAGFAAGSVAEKLPMEVIYQAKDPIVIPETVKPEQASVTLPTAPKQEGKVLCLRFRAFYPVQAPGTQFGGYFLKLEVNGKAINGEMPDETQRVLNRPTMSHDSSGHYPVWADGTLAVSLGPENGELDSRILEPREEGHWYVLNVSDVGNYTWKGVDEMVMGGKPNKIVFTSLRTTNNSDPVSKELRITDLSMGYLPKETVEKLAPVSTIAVPTEISGKKLTAGGFTLTVAPSGAMRIECGKKTYAFRSSFSYPSDKIKYHQFTWEAYDDVDWKTSYASAGGMSGISVKGDCSRYSITRKIVPRDGKFHVSDTVENKTNDPLGMSIHYEVASADRIPASDAYLSGVPNLKDNNRCGPNPTVFLANTGGSLGVAVEDTVFCQQLGMIKKANTVQFGTEHFGLEPHKTYTLEWTLYPTVDADYFTFINRLRKDWNVNFTIPGLFTFSDKAVPALGAKLYAVTPWYDFMDGAGMTPEQYEKDVRAKADAILAIQPDAIPMAKLETPAYTIMRKDIPGGDKIPSKPRTLDMQLNEEQAQILRNSPYWDSMLKNRQGFPIVDTWYADETQFNLNLYPVIGNYCYAHLLKMIDSAMDKGGLKGIYMDSFEFAESLDGGGYRVDLSKWDGHSVDLNGRGEISLKYTDVAPVSAPARAALIRHALEKGGPVACNGHPVARELRSIPYLSLAESDWEMLPDYDSLVRLLSPVEPDICPRMAMGHLHAPVSFGVALWRKDLFHTAPTPEDFEAKHLSEIIQKYVVACLRNGCLCAPSGTIPSSGPGSGDYGIIREMYPFTPVELHEGYLIGKEKILTAVSGIFYWNVTDHPAKPSVCKAFDSKGLPIMPKSFSVAKEGSRWKITLMLQRDWDGTAVVH